MAQEITFTKQADGTWQGSFTSTGTRTLIQIEREENAPLYLNISADNGQHNVIYQPPKPAKDQILSIDIAEGALITIVSHSAVTKAQYIASSLDYYTKSEVDELIVGIHQFEPVVASSLPTASADTMYKFYFIPKQSAGEQTNTKEEWMTVREGSTYRWEKIGETDVDLSNYVTVDDLEEYIENSKSFKGWFNSSSELSAAYPTPKVGDYAYIKGASASDPAAIYECSTAGTWNDSERTVDTSSVQMFATGEEVNEVGIDDEPTVGSENLVKSGGVYIGVSQLEAKVQLLYGGIYTPTYTLIDGKYILWDGKIQDGQAFAVTSPIYVPKGSFVSATCRGYNKIVSIISRYFPNENKYAPLVLDDGTKRAYTYTTEDDMYIVFSYLKSNDLALSVSVPHLLKRVEKLEKENIVTTIIPVVVNTIADKYINQYGVLTDAANFSMTEPISLNKGDKITFYARGYNTAVCVLAKVSSGNYIPIQIGGNLFTRYEYTNNEDHVQVVISFATDNSFYAEILKYGSIKKTVDVKNFNSFAFAGIPIMGIIGDSLSSGVTYKQDETPITDYSKAWWQMLKRDSGMEYKCFATGGLTTRTWLTNQTYGWAKASQSGQECCAYVIALGVNDQWSLGMDYLGAASDINTSDYTQNADTFYGNYAKIIQMLTSLVPAAKFFLTTIPRISILYDAFNNAIREIAGLFANCYLVDLAENYLTEFSSGFLEAHNFGGAHQSALAYQVIGKIFEKAISDTIVDNAVDFRYIQFALDSVS